MHRHLAVSPEESKVSDDAIRAFFRLCLQGRRDPAALEAARDLVQTVALNWQDVLRLAGREFLLPLLYHSLRGQSVVPVAVEQALRATYERTSRRNLLLFHELDTVLRGLSGAGISVIVLKGAALAQPVYGSLALRPLRDLDLLIKPEAVAEARRVLAGLGYAPMDVETHAGTAAEYENEVRLYKRGSLIVLLELHWALIDSPYYQRALPADWFWQSAVPYPGGAGALQLSPPAQLLHLCAHLQLHHTGDELLWLYDIVELIFVYQAEMDWQLIVSLAQAHDLVLPTRRTLARAAAEWQAPVPANALAQLDELRPSADEARVNALLTAENRTVTRRLYADLAGLSGWRARLRFAWSNLFPSAAYMRRRYRIPHPLLLPLYYPYRWLLGLRGAFPR